MPAKVTNTYRVLALDAATNVTGYSVYDDKVLVSYGTFKTDINKDTTSRINELKYWLLAVIKEW